MDDMQNDIADIREKMNLSQFEMALKSELSIRTISSFEVGELSPRGSTKRKLAAAYGITTEQIDRLCKAARRRSEKRSAVAVA